MSVLVEKLFPTQFPFDELIYDYFNNKWIYMEELYEECVVELYSKEAKMGFDLVAIVFDENKKEFIHYKYANQDTYLPNNAWVDASKTITDLYEKELKSVAVIYKRNILILFTD